jgi:hypothetical protein
MKITRHRRRSVLTPTPKHAWIMNISPSLDPSRIFDTSPHLTENITSLRSAPQISEGSKERKLFKIRVYASTEFLIKINI